MQSGEKDSWEQVEDEDEEEMLSDCQSQTLEDVMFSKIIGVLEDFLVDENFHQLSSCFLESNCFQFDESEENKHEYFDLFRQYQVLVDKCLESALLQSLPPEQTVGSVVELVKSHEAQIPLDITDMIHSFNDFGEFKSLMLSYKERLTAPPDSLANLSLTGTSVL